MAYPTVTDEPERRDATSVEALEALWAASADELPHDSAARRAAAWTGERFGWILALGWLGFILSLFAAPAGDPDVVVPLWAESILAGFFMALGTTGILGALRAGRSAYAASTVAGAFGIALAAACGSTEHHAAGWWGYELGATVALMGLSLAGLKRRR